MEYPTTSTHLHIVVSQLVNEHCYRVQGIITLLLRHLVFFPFFVRQPLRMRGHLSLEECGCGHLEEAQHSSVLRSLSHFKKRVCPF